jgi:MFS family permease
MGLLRPITALLIAASVLMLGNGLLGVLIPIRADIAQFSRVEIGLMGSIYYAGLMLGCVVAPRIIARVGHIRAFTAFTASATITPLMHAIWVDPWAWSLLRGLNGFCFAGLFMGIESWLAGASTQETRGRVFAAYTLINLTVITVGMQMIGLGPIGGFELFSVVAVLYSLAAVPVCLSLTSAPNPPRQARLRLGWLFMVSPAAVLGCFFTGVANGAFWQLSPLYASEAGFSSSMVATFISVAVLAGAAAQWPVGQASDRLGRRPLLAVCGLVAATAGLGLSITGEGPAALQVTLISIYGLAAFPIYTLCVAHANDLVHRKRAVEVSSGLLLTFSIGAVIGPLVASFAMWLMGTAAVFVHTALAHLLIAGVMLVRATVRPKPPVRRREEYVVVPNATQAAFELDPRGEDMKPAEDGPPHR